MNKQIDTTFHYYVLVDGDFYDKKKKDLINKQYTIMELTGDELRNKISFIMIAQGDTNVTFIKNIVIGNFITNIVKSDTVVLSGLQGLSVSTLSKKFVQLSGEMSDDEKKKKLIRQIFDFKRSGDNYQMTFSSEFNKKTKSKKMYIITIDLLLCCFCILNNVPVVLYNSHVYYIFDNIDVDKNSKKNPKL